MTEPLVAARGLRKEFQVRAGRRRGTAVAVDGVDFDIRSGETLGLVGESGSGKTTIARMLLKTERPTGGSVLFDGRDIWAQSADEERAYRRVTQAVLQDPYDALSPRMRIGEIIAEPLIAQGVAKKDAVGEVNRLLEIVGMRRDAAARYPHEFSGGQRQRVAIARAVSVNPRFLVLDEPVSALDVSVRAQILELLREMQVRLGLTSLFIGHDLAIVRYISDRVAVLYFGRIVEMGDAEKVLNRPLHPYTRRLLDIATSRPMAGGAEPNTEMPDPLNPPRGCHYRARCPLATGACKVSPDLVDRGDGHRVACHLADAPSASD